jgi:hypothetical protein
VGASRGPLIRREKVGSDKGDFAVFEFRASCGHSIRAREEDVGKTVRCNYCGMRVPVPDLGESALEYLFASEAEQAAERGSQATSGPRRGKGFRIPIIGGLLNETNPVRVLITFAYIGVVLVVVGVGGKMLWRYLDSQLNAKLTDAPPKVVEESPKPAPGGPTVPGGAKIASRSPFPMLEDKGTGLYITSYPPGAAIFVRGLEEDGGTNVKLGTEESESVGRTPFPHKCVAGEYVIGIALPSTQRDLAKFPEYATLRRDLQTKSPAVAAEQYFLPDGSVAMNVEQPPGAPEVFVRRYQAVVRKGKWTPVTALFLPNEPLESLLSHLPTEKVYNVDKERLITELGLLEVPSAAQPGIIELLSRVGKAVYRTEKTGCRIFQLLPDPDELVYSSLASKSGQQ